MHAIFQVPGVDSFLSQRICQDPLERFFGCQRQRGGVNDNPTTAEFFKNTQALRVITSFSQHSNTGNCRGGLVEVSEDHVHSLPRRQHKSKSSVNILEVTSPLLTGMFTIHSTFISYNFLRSLL